MADSTNGIYRRIYGGFLTGKRLNSVSEVAEAWFWRLQALADDYGNLRLVSWRVLSATASPIREVSGAQAEQRTNELIQAGLIQAYQVDGDTYLHVLDFERFQPKGRNGKGFRKVPGPLVNPDESRKIQIDPDESRLIQNNPAPPTPTPTPTPTPIYIPTAPASGAVETPTKQTTIFPPESIDTTTGEVLTKPKATKRKQSASEYGLPGFTAFWIKWPHHYRKRDEGKCFTRWERGGLEEHAAKILESLEAWLQSAEWAKNAGEFIPAPLVWLNGEVWKAAHPPPVGACSSPPPHQPSKQDAARAALMAGFAALEEKREQERKAG